MAVIRPSAMEPPGKLAKTARKYGLKVSDLQKTVVLQTMRNPLHPAPRILTVARRMARQQANWKEIAQTVTRRGPPSVVQSVERKMRYKELHRKLYLFFQSRRAPNPKRNARIIIERLFKGNSFDSIAKTYHVEATTIQAICQKARTALIQEDWFREIVADLAEVSRRD